MKFGVCAELNLAESVKNIGFDYIEPSLTDIFEKSDSQIREEALRLKGLDIKAEASNHFFDNRKHKVVGENAIPLDEIKEYLKIAFYKFKCVGGEIAVCGSGGARRFEETFSKEKALDQFYNVLYCAGDIAKENGITIAIEPLKAGETNIINTVADGLEAVKIINHPNVKVLADLYHVIMMEEGYDAIENSEGNLYHVHTSTPTEIGRRYPKLNDEFSQKPLMDVLKKCGYDMRISLEAGYDNFEPEAKEALQVLKSFC